MSGRVERERAYVVSPSSVVTKEQLEGTVDYLAGLDLPGTPHETTPDSGESGSLGIEGDSAQPFFTDSGAQLLTPPPKSTAPLRVRHYNFVAKDAYAAVKTPPPPPQGRLADATARASEQAIEDDDLHTASVDQLLAAVNDQRPRSGSPPQSAASVGLFEMQNVVKKNKLTRAATQKWTRRADSQLLLNAAELARDRNWTLGGHDLERDIASMLGRKEPGVYVSRIQAVQRGRICRRKREQKRLERAAVKIQAIFRGKATRLAVHRGESTAAKGLRDIQIRLNKASQKALASFFRKKPTNGTTASTNLADGAGSAFIPTDDYKMTLDRDITITQGRLEFEGGVPRQLLDPNAHSLQAARQAKFIRLPVRLFFVSEPLR